MKLLNLLTFAFALLFADFVLATNNNTNQNTNNKNSIYFKTANKSAEHSFLSTDARALEKYLFSNNKITDCDQESLSVMLETPNGQQNIVRELYRVGYAVLELSCSQQNIVITLSKTPNDLASIAIHFEKQELLAKAKILEEKNQLSNATASLSNDADCDDCGEVSLSQDILNEFKDTNYGGQLIDFGSTTTTEQVANMQNESSVFAVESENIVCEECEASLLTENMMDDAVAKLKEANNNELVEDALELELENSSVYRIPNK